MGALSRRGFSLVETVIAAFILTCGFLVMGAVFHSALRYTARIESTQVATLLAEKKAEELKAWSQGRLGSDFSDFSNVQADVGGQDSDFPGYNVTITPLNPGSGTPVLYAPCEEFEKAESDKRGMSRHAARYVRIRVTWAEGRFDLYTLVGLPMARSITIDVSPGGADTINRDGDRTYTATATDNLGQEVPDLKYQWYIEGTGNGTLNPSRDGTSVKLTHFIKVGSLTGYGSGGCHLVAVARYHGKRYEGRTGLLDLQ